MNDVQTLIYDMRAAKRRLRRGETARIRTPRGEPVVLTSIQEFERLVDELIHELRNNVQISDEVAA